MRRHARNPEARSIAARSRYGGHRRVELRSARAGTGDDLLENARVAVASPLPAKIDAKRGQEFPGDYAFNPYTGEPLVPK